MDPRTRLINGIYVGPKDPAVYPPGSPQAAAQAQAMREQREKWDWLVRDLVAFDPTRSSSLLLPRPSAAWTAPENGQRFAARLAQAISLSYESPLGLQVTDCLMLATNYPHERAFTLLKDLEIGLEHAVAACMRISVPNAAPHIARARLLNRVLNLQGDTAVGDQNRILHLLAMAGIVIAGQDRSQMEGLRRFLTNPVLEWEPLKHHPLAHSLLDDFLDLQWPADPARALKQAIYEVLGRGRSTAAAPQPDPEPVPKRRPPTKAELQAWALCSHLRKTQAEAAELMSTETGESWSQPRVSRACARVTAYLKAGGQVGVPPAPARRPAHGRPVSMEPEKLEGGSGTIRTRPKEDVDPDEETTMQG